MQTTIEKNRKIREHCTQCTCEYCALFNAGLSPCWFVRDLEDHEDEIEQRYRILFGADEDETEKVNHPGHYQGKHECIDEMIALFGTEAVKAFCKCNVYKYRYRADKKNGAEDIAKADWYMDKLIELQQKGNPIRLFSERGNA